MMNSVARTIDVDVARPPPDDCPSERQLLGAAIEAEQRAKRAVTDARDALQRAITKAAAAAGEAETSAAGVAAAKASDAEAMATVVRTGAGAKPSATREARQKAEIAADDADVAAAAVARLRADLADAEQKAADAKLGVEAAVNTVLSVATEPLVDRLVAIKGEILTLQAVLDFVQRRSMVDRGAYAEEVPELAEPLAEVLPRIGPAIMHGLLFNPAAARQHPAARRWQDAVAALAEDADAQLPT